MLLINLLNMNKDNLTGRELSEKLAEAGCDLKSEYFYLSNQKDMKTYFIGTEKDRCPDGRTIAYRYKIKCYDILNDICCKHAKEFFGEEEIETDLHHCSRVWEAWRLGTMSEDDFEIYTMYEYQFHSNEIIDLRQQNRKQEAEEYFWEHCKFNPNNHD